MWSADMPGHVCVDLFADSLVSTAGWGGWGMGEGGTPTTVLAPPPPPLLVTNQPPPSMILLSVPGLTSSILRPPSSHVASSPSPPLPCPPHLLTSSWPPAPYKYTHPLAQEVTVGWPIRALYTHTGTQTREEPVLASVHSTVQCE